MGIGKFQPPQNQHPWTNRQKIRHSWLCPRGDSLYQIWYKSIHWGLLGKWVKYNKNYFYLYLFFLKHAHRSDPWILFTRDSSKDMKSRKDVPFGGLNDVPLNFGVKLPKNWNFGSVNMTFKPERQKFQTLITWNLLIRSSRNFYREYAPRVCRRGWFHGSSQQIQDGGGRHL